MPVKKLNQNKPKSLFSSFDPPPDNPPPPNHQPGVSYKSLGAQDTRLSACILPRLRSIQSDQKQVKQGSWKNGSGSSQPMQPMQSSPKNSDFNGHLITVAKGFSMVQLAEGMEMCGMALSTIRPACMRGPHASRFAPHPGPVWQLPHTHIS